MKEFRYLSHEYSEDIYTPIPYRPWKERFLLLFELKTWKMIQMDQMCFCFRRYLHSMTKVVRIR